MTQFLQHPKLGHRDASVGRRNIARQRIRRFAKVVWQGVLDQSQQCVQPVFFGEQVGHQRADLFQPVAVIPPEHGKDADNRCDRMQFLVADPLVCGGCRDHNRYQRVLRVKGVDVHWALPVLA